MDPKLLIDDYLNARLSKKQRKVLIAWVKENPRHLNYFKERIRSHAYVIPLKFDSEKAFDHFYNHIQRKRLQRKRRLQLIPIAASFAALLALGILYQDSLGFASKDSKVVQEETNKSIKQIQITLPDGSQQLIDKKNTSYLRTSTGALVASKTKDVLEFGTDKSEIQDTTYSQIDIPYGEKLRLKLSDGTLVWLNSGTTFRFPQSFKTDSRLRKVEVIGEAYFEVKKDSSRPFIVTTPEVDIRVLGTHFNVSSYTNDPQSKTTLLEGKVQVYDPSQADSPLELTPNEQAVFKKTNQKLKRHKVQASRYTTWINDILIVDGLTFLELKKKLERRYKVTITSEINDLWETVYKGQFQDESLRETLETIALSSHFDFEIDGEHVRIYDKKTQPTTNKSK